MPHPNDPPDKARQSLDQRLEAAEAAQAREASPETHVAMAQSYRFVGEVVGGVLGGVGLGWLLDRFAHTQPWGVVGGLLIGTGLSIFTAVTAVARANKIALELQAPAPGVPDEEDDED